MIYTQNIIRRIGVVGLGYVGLPVALAFAKAGALVVGFDIDGGRIDDLDSLTWEKTDKAGELKKAAR